MNRDTARAQLIQQIAGGTLPDDAAEFLTNDLRCTVAEIAAEFLATRAGNHTAPQKAVIQVLAAELTAMCLIMVACHQTKGDTP